jgi:glycosyltransferase involved in cell wall biosynthesis
MDNQPIAKLKILLLAPTSIPQGGIANWARLLLKNSTRERVEYKTIDTSLHYRVLGGKTGFYDRICGLRDAFFRGIRLLTDLMVYKPDIVYFTCAPSVGFAFRDAPLILLCKLFGRRVVIHLRGGSLEGFWGGGALRRMLANLGSKLADYIFVLTRDCEKAAREKFGNGKVAYIPNYIDINSANEAGNNAPKEINKDKFNVIHVGYQCREKGTFEIIEAAKKLPDNVNILLIGIVSEDKRKLIEDAIFKNDVSNKVKLLGTRHKPEIWGYYRNADLFLFPTYTEGFPNVIMEAMLFGLPILVTDVGNIAEITNAGGERPAALLLDNADPPNSLEISDKIMYLIQNHELRRKLSKNGFERVRGYYSVDVVIPQLEAVLVAISLDQDALSESRNYFQQNEISN